MFCLSYTPLYRYFILLPFECLHQFIYLCYWHILRQLLFMLSFSVVPTSVLK
uniref:Uncharacterized protein n=1 Tax=Arundo donax TaxID=35708 RepID=A0A0A8XW48_ARUDO